VEGHVGLLPGIQENGEVEPLGAEELGGEAALFFGIAGLSRRVATAEREPRDGPLRSRTDSGRLASGAAQRSACLLSPKAVAILSREATPRKPDSPHLPSFPDGNAGDRLFFVADDGVSG
jgi:hypothetical protein